MEYQGFDPCTSCLRSTHASDCANTPTVGRGACRKRGQNNVSRKKNPHSVTGNRTPGICVTGRDVTNYTMTDDGADTAWPSVAPIPGPAVAVRAAPASWFGHIKVNAAHPIRTANLSTFELNQYYSGGPCGNLEC